MREGAGDGSHHVQMAKVTLVVGRIAGPRVSIASDTLLTGPGGQALPFQDGVIKSCMLPGNVCVSFSNSPVTAGRAFKDFARTYPAGASFNDVVTFFERSSESTGNDYLVAFANPARLIKIVDGERTSSLSASLLRHRPVHHRCEERDGSAELLANTKP